MYPKKIARLTRQTKADIGLSFDGDADRVIISDEKGQVLDGDIIIAAIAKYYGLKKKFKIKSVVSTYMCNIGFRDFLKKLKIKLHLTKVGDRYVIQKMKEANVNLGGEQSGHIIFSDNGYCGDGILTAMFIINVMSMQKIELSKLTENLFLKSCQKLVNMKTKINSEKIIKHPEMKKALKNIKVKNTNLDYLIRKSGTENLLRIMVQSKNKNEVSEVLKTLVNLVKKLDG
jgi:phosphoglucosamine mutase